MIGFSLSPGTRIFKEHSNHSTAANNLTWERKARRPLADGTDREEKETQPLTFWWSLQGLPCQYSRGGESVKRALLAVGSAGQERTPGRQEVSLVPLKLDRPPQRRQNLSLKTSSESCNCPKYSVCLDCICQIYSPGNDLGALKID